MSNYVHATERYNERISAGYEDRWEAALRGIKAKMKAGTMVNSMWYRPVTDKHTQDVLGYVVGQGNWISTILASDMTPKGIRI